MLQIIAKGLFGRLLGLALLTLGFWLLLKGFSGPSVPLVLLGGAVIIGAMYIMVHARKAGLSPGVSPGSSRRSYEEEEEILGEYTSSKDGGDTGDGSGQSS